MQPGSSSSERTFKSVITGLFGVLFDPGDHVHVAVGTVRNDQCYRRDEAVAYILRNEGLPNLWFSHSACIAPGGGRNKGNCRSTRAFGLDLDYGKVGHRKPTPFDDFWEAQTYLKSLPVTPSVAWHTGHGIQAMYLLDEPFDLSAGGEGNAGMARYEEVSRKLTRMALSDPTHTAHQWFRVPKTINDKNMENCPPVRGETVWWNPSRQFSLEAICDFADGYGVDDLKSLAPPPEMPSEVRAAYEELPPAVREYVEAHHPEGTRSDALQKAVWALRFAGCGDDEIIEFAGRGPSFQEAYPGRLPGEIRRCIEKTGGAKVKGLVGDQPLGLPARRVREVGLPECPDLDPAMAEMLGRYAVSEKIELTGQVRDSARFLEHVLAGTKRAVADLPCGFGKSTWAVSHMAVHASDARRFIYVTDTRDAMRGAAGLLERLRSEVSVGRVHGFDDKYCHDLCGQWHRWQDCAPRGPVTRGEESDCGKCDARDRCTFYTREDQMKADVLMMVHEGFLRLLERSKALPWPKFTVIVDEDINGFLDAEFTREELLGVCTYMEDVAVVGGASYEIGRLFPGTTFGAAVEASRIGGRIFAAEHYYYHTAGRAGFSDTEVNLLRQVFKAPPLGKFLVADPEFRKSGRLELARVVISRLIGFFRGCGGEDVAYALREVRTDGGIRYRLRKQRTSVDADKGFGKLIVLNASARLSHQQYVETLDLYRCPELAAVCSGARLHVIRGNPFEGNFERHVSAARRLVETGAVRGEHRHILLATGKDPENLGALTTWLKEAFPAAEVHHITRGRLRGTNEAGECTLVVMAAMSLFTTVDDCALLTALKCRRTFSTGEVFNNAGQPKMPRGRFTFSRMYELFAHRGLDELYQALYRSALRNGKEVEAIVVLPGFEWVSLLYRTVMPGFRLAGAYWFTDDGKLVTDQQITGFMDLVDMPAGAEVRKRKAAEMLGYHPESGWRENRQRIRPWLEPFFYDKGQSLVRRDDTRSDEQQEQGG